MSIRRHRLYVVTLFVVFASWCLCQAQDKIIAIVNKDVITQKDLDDFVSFTTMQYKAEYQGEQLRAKIQSMQKDLLDKLIEDRLIVQEAKTTNIRIDESRIKLRIAEIKKQYGSDVQFQAALARQGLVQADMELKVREQFLMYSFIDMNVKSKITVKPSEVTEFFQKNPKEFELPEQREFDMVALEDDTLAEAIYQSVKAGQTLDEVLKGKSLSANKICVAKGEQLKKEIEDTIFSLNVGEVSKPLKIENKHYIFRLNNSIKPRQQTLGEVQEKIFAFLFEKKMQENVDKLLHELRAKSYIKIF